VMKHVLIEILTENIQEFLTTLRLFTSNLSKKLIHKINLNASKLSITLLSNISI